MSDTLIKDFKAYVGSYKSFNHWLWSVGNESIFHILAYIDCYRQASSAFESGEWDLLAFQMGRFLRIIINSPPVDQTQNQVQFTDNILEDAQKFWMGFFEGSIVFMTPNIKQCDQESSAFIVKMNKAIEEFKKETDSGIE